MKKILFTGFEPFDGAATNPSWDAVSLLPEEIDGCRISRILLPVEYDSVGSLLDAAIAKEQPDAVICVGQAGGRSAITPEMVAINLKDASIPDNAGISYDGVPILEGAPAAYFATIPGKSIVRGMKPLVMILVFTGVLNLFFNKDGRVLVDFWGITITTGGAERAAFMLVRILMLVTATFLLTYTTSPISLTDGLESLMNPLKVIKVPVHELSMMMCIALRFIPTLIEETDKIMSAQKARGADFESGKLMERAKALIPILVPLFISAFRRADELATAMECRCYQGGEGRTKMKQLHYQRNDFAAFGAAALLTAAVIILKKFGM